MNEFCGSEFWDYNLTWNTTDPELTPCFEQTVLVWVPCGFLWAFSIIELSYLRASGNRNVPWNVLNVLKMVLLAILVAVTVSDLAKAISTGGPDAPVYIYIPIIKLATFIYVAALVYLNKFYGMRTSGVLFLFWSLLVICSIPRCRTEIRAHLNRSESDPWAEYQFVSFMISFCCYCVLFVLNFFVDERARVMEYEVTDKECPELSASFPSRLLFSWFDRFLWKGYKKPLENEDLWDIKWENSSRVNFPLFDGYWKQTVEKTLKSRGLSKSSKTKKVASIVTPLIRAYGVPFAFGSFLHLVQDVLTFMSPQILRLIIDFVDSSEPLWKGILYAVLLFLVAITQTVLSHQCMVYMFGIGLRIRTALVSAIYRKALVVSSSAKKESTVGEVVNLMAVDAQRFTDLMQYLCAAWSVPLQIGLSLFFLWELLGPAVFAGLAVMVVVMPLNAYLANRLKNLDLKEMKYKDDRVRDMNEILCGIKVLKLYAWEPSFEKKIRQIRDKEAKVLKSAMYLNSWTSFMWTTTPFLVTLVTFATYVLMDENNVLDATTAFVSLALFAILRNPLSWLPFLVTHLVQTYVSINRINKYLNHDELNPDNVQHDRKESSPLLIENGNFSWGDDETTLQDINIQVGKNELAAIVGTVGSGKSSILSAFLGEMDKLSGRVNTVGTIAYVSQQAWIQNATLRDNILFGKPMDNKRYQKIIAACALKPDLEMLPGGDQTEIGEKGINLSGGQKQRVSLARAVYNDADIYFLDDPLSAVDSHVGKHIFEQVIGENGLLAKKTRLLVTHGITYLPFTDNIYVVKDGKIDESGSYQELLDKKGAFAEFLLQHLQNVNQESENIDDIKAQLETSVGNEELRAKLVRAISRQSRTESTSDAGSTHKSFSRQISETESITSTRKSKLDLDNVPNERLIEEEKAEIGNVKWSVYNHYMKSIGISFSVTTVIFSLLYQSFSVGSNLWLSEWSMDQNNDTSVRDKYLSVYGTLGIGHAISSFLCDLIPLLGAWKAAVYLHNHLLSSILRLPLSFFDTTPTGRILSRFSKDIDVLDNTLPQSVSALFYYVFELIATLAVIIFTIPIFTAAIIPIGILYYLVQRVFVATSRQLRRLESVSRSPIYSHFGETIQGTQTIRAYGVQDRFIGLSEARVDFNQVCKFPSMIANRWLAIRMEGLGNFIVLFVALFAVWGRETMNPGMVGLSILYALQITQTLNWLVRVTSELETNIVAVERIKEYGETKPEAAWELQNSTLSRDWPEQGRVEFQDFQVRYREGLDLVLKGISFTVEGGEKVGIVGRTGAGKSSLTLALFRIIESAGGKIIIDGQDISQLGLHELRSRLTIIPQDPVLFSGTMRLNLDPLNAHSDEDIWKTLEHAHLKAFVKGLPAGINHEVSEGGENLSVGQRQLICLARALLGKTQILILDEATAAVDLETDDLIQRTIRTEFSHCTVLTIAHRLNTIMDSDKVIVLNKGRIEEFAAPSELLLNKSSAFYSMAKDAGLI
ncbi:multidrug resistance-associated protein 1 [Culex quinquefasciatus]|uniref:multidrug resistance-associated protein 1 n=1 Tax=Culex quinquefasciatus TaxID=7176 RepID=UPI0018E2D7D7|nr:multidrug resistance-associated protein 1 [Culex quinquefasciatus]